MVSAYVSPQASLQALTSASIIPQGRITLTTLVPVLAATVSAAATVFYTPYQGALIPIYDGSRYVARVFAELSNVLANSATGSAGPAAGAASKNYDLFVWNNAGTLTLTRGGAWNSDTVRSSTTENDLQMVTGILTNLNAITNGPGVGLGTYVGTVRTDAGGATVTFVLGASAAGGTAANIGFWNCYNRRDFAMYVEDSNAAYAYTSSTIRSADASATMRISVIKGLNEDGIEAEYQSRTSLPAAAFAFSEIMIGLDSTTAKSSLSSRRIMRDFNSATAADVSGSAKFSGLVGLGWHFLQALEAGDNTNAANLGGTGGYNALIAKTQA